MSLTRPWTVGVLIGWCVLRDMAFFLSCLFFFVLFFLTWRGGWGRSLPCRFESRDWYVLYVLCEGRLGGSFFSVKAGRGARFCVYHHTVGCVVDHLMSFLGGVLLRCASRTGPDGRAELKVL